MVYIYLILQGFRQQILVVPLHARIELEPDRNQGLMETDVTGTRTVFRQRTTLIACT